jgi:hypothetical protein
MIPIINFGTSSLLQKFPQMKFYCAKAEKSAMWFFKIKVSQQIKMFFRTDNLIWDCFWSFSYVEILLSI